MLYGKNWVIASMKQICVVISIAALLLLGYRAIFNFDMAWDSVAYHMPFAARHFGICDKNCYAMMPFIESQYNAVPQLADTLHGIF